MKVLKQIGLFLIMALFICLIVLFFLPSKSNPSNLPPDILFAHKAISNKYPENSIESILYLKQWGVNAIEIDLRKTTDNTWVLFHDNNGKILLNNDKKLADFTFAELKNLNLFLKSETICKVPSLDSVLERVKDSVYFYLDLKTPSFNNAKEIVELIKYYNLNKTVILASTDGLLILYVKIFYPDIMVALEGFNSGKEILHTLTPNRLKPDFLSGFYFRTNEKHVRWLKKHNLLESKIVYGVDTSSMKTVIDMGYKKIMADFDSTMFSDYQNEK